MNSLRDPAVRVAGDVGFVPHAESVTVCVTVTVTTLGFVGAVPVGEAVEEDVVLVVVVMLAARVLDEVVEEEDRAVVVLDEGVEVILELELALGLVAFAFICAKIASVT